MDQWMEGWVDQWMYRYVGGWMDESLRMKIEVGTFTGKAGLGRGILVGRLEYVLRPRREVN